MKWYKKVFWWLFAIFGVSLLTLSVYGMGEDIIEFIPDWLAAYVVGLVTLIIICVIAGVFAFGILKIKETFKGETRSTRKRRQS